MHSEGVGERGCGGERGEEGEENDVKWGKRVKKNLEHFAKLSSLYRLHLSVI